MYGNFDTFNWSNLTSYTWSDAEWILMDNKRPQFPYFFWLAWYSDLELYSRSCHNAIYTLGFHTLQGKLHG